MVGQRFDADLRQKTETKLVPFAKDKARPVIVVLPMTKRSMYDHLKRLSDVQLGVKTICVTLANLREKDKGYFSQLALKLNLKEGGIHQSLKSPTPNALQDGNMMIVGLDLIVAPKSARNGAKDVVVAVAARNNKLAQWPAAVKVVNGPSFEDEIAGLLDDHLESWKTARNDYPHKVIVYYNGSIALNRETCIRRGEEKSQRSIDMAFVAVTRDHSAHLRTLSPSDASSESGFISTHGMLVRSQSLVDSKDNSWSFTIQNHKPQKTYSQDQRPEKERQERYIQSGQWPADQSTLPVRYSVIQNNIFKNVREKEELEKLTYDMCYLYGCGTSVVTNTLPIHYAGLLCDRVRSYVRPWYEPNEGNMMDGDGVMTQNTVQIHKNIAGTMFYV